MKTEFDPFRRLLVRWRQRRVGCFLCNEHRMVGDTRPPCERCSLLLLMIHDLEELIYQLEAPKP